MMTNIIHYKTTANNLLDYFRINNRHEIPLQQKIVLNNGCYYENNHEEKRGERACKSAKKLKLVLFAGSVIYIKF